MDLMRNNTHFVILVAFVFLIGIHSIQSWTITTRHGLIKKEEEKVEENHTPQNFCLAFIDELEKQLFIKNTVEVG